MRGGKVLRRDVHSAQVRSDLAPPRLGSKHTRNTSWGLAEYSQQTVTKSVSFQGGGSFLSVSHDANRFRSIRSTF